MRIVSTCPLYWEIFQGFLQGFFFRELLFINSSKTLSENSLENAINASIIFNKDFYRTFGHILFGYSKISKRKKSFRNFFRKFSADSPKDFFKNCSTRSSFMQNYPESFQKIHQNMFMRIPQKCLQKLYHEVLLKFPQGFQLKFLRRIHYNFFQEFL